MANGYITYNGKRYRLTPQSYEEQLDPARQTNVSLSGKTITQLFAYSETRFEMEIWTAITAESGTYGSMSDLKTAIGLAYANFTDIFGTVHSVVPEGGLRLPYKLGIRTNTAPFKVKLTLRKRNT